MKMKETLIQEVLQTKLPLAVTLALLPSLFVSNVKGRVNVSLFKITHSKNVRLQTSHFIIVWQFTEVYSSPERFTEIYIFPAFYQTEETMPIPRTQIQFVQFLNKMSGPCPQLLTVLCHSSPRDPWSMVKVMCPHLRKLLVTRII